MQRPVCCRSTRWLVFFMSTLLVLALLFGGLRLRRDRPGSWIAPLVDKDDARTKAEIAEMLPFVPVEFSLRNENRATFFENASCASMPALADLNYNNVYWQTMRTANGTFFLYGAYFDDRALSRAGPSVRVLTLLNRIEPAVEIHCQLRMPDRKAPLLVKMTEYNCIWMPHWTDYKQGEFLPYLLTCPIPESARGQLPISVSLAERPCDLAKNHLRVYYNHPPARKGFAVCVKGLDVRHADVSVRLVEWIELLGILGADKIFFYELQAHRNVKKVLRFYERQGRVSVTPLTLAGTAPNVPGLQHIYLNRMRRSKRHNEVIPLNDCLYKNLYSYEYIVLLDIDEVIVPTAAQGWRDLIDRVVLPKAIAAEQQVPATLFARNVFFLDEMLQPHAKLEGIPPFMHMLLHVNRSKMFTAPYDFIKAFHDPEQVLTLHNHFPVSCLTGECLWYPIPTEDAKLHHYRTTCTEDLGNACDQFRRHTVMDTTMWRFKDELVARTSKALLALGFL